MIRSAIRTSNLGVKCIAEKTDPAFKHSAKPFSFLCNPNLQMVWTPNELFEKKGVTDLGNCRFISVYLSSENLNQVLYAIEAWTEAGKHVYIRFPVMRRRPVVGTIEDPTFFGLDVSQCFDLVPTGWLASDKLKFAVTEFFKSCPSVRVIL
jgi:hypothetical protein